MIILLNDQSEYRGDTYTDVVVQMKSRAFGAETQSMDEYIDDVVRQIRRLAWVALDVRGESTEERARSLIQELIAKRFAVEVFGELPGNDNATEA